MKKILNIRLALLSIMIAASFASCQKENSTGEPAAPSKPLINFVPAKTSSELLALRAQKSANIIRTLSDFDATVSAKNTPLNKLTSEQLANFRNSLVVRDNIGVVSFYYGDLKETLSYDDFATVVSLFGLDIKEGYWGLSNDPVIQAKLTPPTLVTNANESNNSVSINSLDDHNGYLCSALLLHTCKKAKDSICLSGC